MAVPMPIEPSITRLTSRTAAAMDVAMSPVMGPVMGMNAGTAAGAGRWTTGKSACSCCR